MMHPIIKSLAKTTFLSHNCVLTIMPMCVDNHVYSKKVCDQVLFLFIIIIIVAMVVWRAGLLSFTLVWQTTLWVKPA